VAFAELSPLGQVVVCGLFLLMVYGWMQTGGKVVQWLAAHIPNVSVGLPYLGSTSLFGWLINALNGFDNYVQRVFYFYLDGTKAGWNGWCHQVASFVANVTETADFVATETQRALAVLRHSTIPALILGTLAPGSQLLTWLVAHVAALVKAGIHVVEVPPQILKKTITVVEQLPPKTTKIITRDLPAAIAAAIAGTLPRIRTLEREASGVEKWIRSHAEPLGLGAIVGATAYALGKLGLTSSRCSNVQKYNKRLCGMEQGLLDSLLADTTLILGTVSLVEFARGMQGVTAEAVPLIRRFWRAA
jgi:hypothetical protein